MSDSDISKGKYGRGQSPASRANLAQFRTVQPETVSEIKAEKSPEATTTVIVAETANPMLAQRLVAQHMAVNAAPRMVEVLVATAEGRGRGVPHSVRVQAAGKVLEAAGVVGSGAQQTRTPVGDLADFDAESLRSFVEAGTRAIELRRMRAAAEDAVIVQP